MNSPQKIKDELRKCLESLKTPGGKKWNIREEKINNCNFSGVHLYKACLVYSSGTKDCKYIAMVIDLNVYSEQEYDKNLKIVEELISSKIIARPLKNQKCENINYGIIITEEWGVPFKQNFEKMYEYRKSIVLGVHNLMNLQFKGADMYYLGNPQRVEGAIRVGVNDSRIRIDTTQHTIDAFLKVIEVFELN